MTARAGLLRHLTGQSLCPRPRPVDEATGLLDAYRDEVLTQAAPPCAVCETPIEWVACPTGGWWAHHAHPEDGHDALPPGVPTRAEVLHEVAAELDRIADRFGPSAQVLRDVAGNVRYMAGKDTPAGGESTQPGFFQPGHGYTHRNGTDFQCIAVADQPNTGEPRAFGWIVSHGWHIPAAKDPDDWQQYDSCAEPADGGR